MRDGRSLLAFVENSDVVYCTKSENCKAGLKFYTSFFFTIRSLTFFSTQVAPLKQAVLEQMGADPSQLIPSKPRGHEHLKHLAWRFKKKELQGAYTLYCIVIPKRW